MAELQTWMKWVKNEPDHLWIIFIIFQMKRNLLINLILFQTWEIGFLYFGFSLIKIQLYASMIQFSNSSNS